MRFYYEGDPKDPWAGVVIGILMVALVVSLLWR